MALQNHQIKLYDDDSMDNPHKFKESFIHAFYKRPQFDLKYSVSQIQSLIQKDFGISVVQDLALSSSTALSSFQLLHQAIPHLPSCHEGSEQNMPQFRKHLIRIVISDSQVRGEPTVEELLGSKLKELESVGVHEEQTQDHNALATINSNNSDILSSASFTKDNSSNTVTPSNSSVSHEISVQQIDPIRPNNVPSMASDSYTIMPMTIYPTPPHDDNKLGFTVFAVELIGALTNLVVSSRPKHNQVMIYVVVAFSTLAFCISSTALVLHKKRPATAKKMQKVAFLIGTFGFMGIMGMLLPSTITWCFTISAFLFCMLMFAVANLIE